ncbi:MAG: hypothetical protein O7G84_11735 [Gammaproteobacteria bacterium]|nr:hypothetical protein [Gammaproteobacteria bacterium]
MLDTQDVLAGEQIIGLDGCGANHDVIDSQVGAHGLRFDDERRGPKSDAGTHPNERKLHHAENARDDRPCASAL